jgi:hypothetical protein
MIKAFFNVDVHDSRQIEDNARIIGDDILEKTVIVITNAEEAIRKIKDYSNICIAEIVLTNLSPNREELVMLIAKEMVPALR